MPLESSRISSSSSSSASFSTGIADAVAVCVGLRRACLLEGSAALRGSAILRAAACLAGPDLLADAADAIRIFSLEGQTFILNVRQVSAASAALSGEDGARLLVLAIRRSNAKHAALSVACARQMAEVSRGLVRASSAIAEAVAGPASDRSSLSTGARRAAADSSTGGGAFGWLTPPSHKRKAAGAAHLPLGVAAAAADGARCGSARADVRAVCLLTELDEGICRVTLAGWLLEYPAVYNCRLAIESGGGSGAAAAGSGAAAASADESSQDGGVGSCLDGERLLLCTAVCTIPLLGSACPAASALLAEAGAGADFLSRLRASRASSLERSPSSSAAALNSALPSIEASIAFSLPVARCSDDARDARASAALRGGGEAAQAPCDGAAPCAALPPHAHSVVHGWECRLRARIEALNRRSHCSCSGRIGAAAGDGGEAAAGLAPSAECAAAAAEAGDRPAFAGSGGSGSCSERVRASAAFAFALIEPGRTRFVV